MMTHELSTGGHLMVKVDDGVDYYMVNVSTGQISKKFTTHPDGVAAMRVILWQMGQPPPPQAAVVLPQLKTIPGVATAVAQSSSGSSSVPVAPSKG
jgi:hypothetical protein